MLVGLIEKQGSQGMTGEGSLKILFERSGAEIAQGIVLSTNSGGIQFHVPLATVFVKPEEKVEFRVDLPFHGGIKLVGKLQQYRIGLDNHQNRIAYYETKFSNLSRDVWNDLVDYINTPVEHNGVKSGAGGLLVNRVSENRIDFRVNVTSVKIEIKPVKGKLIRGHLGDLSIGGAKVILPQELPLGTKATFRIRRKAFQLLMNVECTRNESSGEGFEVGLRFEELTKEQFERLRDIVFRLVGSE